MTLRPWLCSIALALGVGVSALASPNAAAEEPPAEPPATAAPTATSGELSAVPSGPQAPASADAVPQPSSAQPPAPPSGAEAAAEDESATPAAEEPSYDQAAPPPPTAGADEQPSSTDWPYVGGWVSWGVGAAVLTVFHYAFFSLNGVVRDDAMKSYRNGVLEGESSCDQARAGLPSSADGAASPQEVADLCDEADTLETLRNVTLPIGLAAALVGLVLVGTSDTVNGDSEPDDQAGAWRLRFGAGPQGGEATVQVSF